MKATWFALALALSCLFTTVALAHNDAPDADAPAATPADPTGHPEPVTWILFGAGAGALALYRRKRSQTEQLPSA